MITDTCVDPTGPLVAFLLDEYPDLDEQVYGERFPDDFDLPAVVVQYTSATQTYIRVQVVVKAEVEDKGGGGMPEAMSVWQEVDRLLNFCAPRVCGLNNGFVRRDDGSPRVSREPNTDRAVVAAYYLLEMGG